MSVREVTIENDDLYVDYERETMKDKLFYLIQSFCFSYISKQKTDVDIDMLNGYMIFLDEMVEELYTLKKAFGLYKNSPFVDLAKEIDVITISEDIERETITKSKYIVSERINNLIENVLYCYGIIELAIERKENDYRN